MDYRKVITIEPGKRGGKPCIRGLRTTVYDVLEYLASGMSVGGHPGGRSLLLLDHILSPSLTRS